MTFQSKKKKKKKNSASKLPLISNCNTAALTWVYSLPTSPIYFELSSCHNFVKLSLNKSINLSLSLSLSAPLTIMVSFLRELYISLMQKKSQLTNAFR